MSGSNSTSVFNALGSYADRIKDVNGNPLKSSASSSDGAPAPTPAVAPPQQQPKEKSSQSASQTKEKSTQEDDGPWETVQSGRQRNHSNNTRSDERDSSHTKRGSSSKNWRDRSGREGAGEKEKERKDDEGSSADKKRDGKDRARKSDKVMGASPTSTNVEKEKEKPVKASAGKSAWNIPSQSVSASPTPAAQESSPITAPATEALRPSGNGTENGISRGDSIKATEGQERTEESVVKPKELAPPPKVNVWDLRKKQSTISVSVPPPVQSTVKSIPNGVQKGDSSPTPSATAVTSGAGKGVSKKKSAAAAVGSTAPPAINDAHLWPDVATAVKDKEGKEKKSKGKVESETASLAEEQVTNAGTGKKPKWTAIPAHEMLAAADQAAEQSRRQNRLEAKKRSAREGETPSAAPGKATKPKKLSAAESSSLNGTPGKKAVRAAKEAAGTNVKGDAESAGKVNGESKGKEQENKAGSSRRDSSPAPPTANHPESTPAHESSATQTERQPTSKPMQTSQTAPIPSHNFINPTAGAARPPRGRNDPARGSFGGRGRGGFRSNSAIAHHKGHGAPYTSPPMGVMGLPMEGMTYPAGNAPNLYQRGFGMGYQPFYPAAAGGASANATGQTVYTGQGIYDPMQYANAYRGASMPPPPMPQTVVPNLDPLRFYVLGQVEYYFSMQNLAMDFFLRQQMDSEGWIDIGMIASFNRIKSLTPDVAVVREVMSLSSYLEVRDDKVRLAGAESHRWVLPEAKASTLKPDPSQTEGSVEEGAKEGSLTEHGVEAVEGSEGAAAGMGGHRSPANTQRGFVAADVQSALMKSSSQQAQAREAAKEADAEASANTSVADTTATPATSTSGDVAKNDKEEESKAEQ
ncbi:hypothetical protein IAR50_005732 [Cryptococcus sp. DSM 104548]